MMELSTARFQAVLDRASAAVAESDVLVAQVLALLERLDPVAPGMGADLTGLFARMEVLAPE